MQRNKKFGFYSGSHETHWGFKAGSLTLHRKVRGRVMGQRVMKKQGDRAVFIWGPGADLELMGQ